MSITAERLRQILAYDPATGVFTWRMRTAIRATVGSVAGSINSDGYILISIDDRKHRAHRLAWMWMYGEWPKHQVDHINGIRTDNRIVNLRNVSSIVNSQNERSARRNNKTGLLGVRPSGNRFQSAIRIDGNKTHLGCFETPELAHAAYVAAKRKFHEGCTI